jgi:hypothetical protein
MISEPPLPHTDHCLIYLLDGYHLGIVMARIPWAAIKLPAVFGRPVFRNR